MAGWRLGELAFGLVLLTAGPAAADWMSNTGGGWREAFVLGDAGGLLNVTCGYDRPDRLAGFYFDLGGAAAAEAGGLYAVHLTSGAWHETWEMQLVLSDSLEVEFNDPALLERLQRTLDAFAAGGELTAEAPDLEWRERYPLGGAAQELAGILDGCRD